MLRNKKYRIIYAIFITLFFTLSINAMPAAKNRIELTTSTTGYLSHLIEAIDENDPKGSIEKFLNVKPSKLAGPQAYISKFPSKVLSAVYTQKEALVTKLTSLLKALERSGDRDLIKPAKNLAEFLTDETGYFIRTFEIKAPTSYDAFFKDIKAVAKQFSELSKTLEKTGDIIKDKKKAEEEFTEQKKGLESQIKEMTEELAKQKEALNKEFEGKQTELDTKPKGDPATSRQAEAAANQADLNALQIGNDYIEMMITESAGGINEKLAIYAKENKDYDQIDALILITTTFLEEANKNINIFKAIATSQTSIDKLSEAAKSTLSSLKQLGAEKTQDLFIPTETKTDSTELTNLEKRFKKIHDRVQNTNKTIEDVKESLIKSIKLYADIVKKIGKSTTQYISANSDNVLAKKIDISGITEKTIENKLKEEKNLKVDDSWTKSTTFETFVFGTQEECKKYMAAVKAAFDEFSKQVTPVITNYIAAVNIINSIANPKITNYSAEIEKVFVKEKATGAVAWTKALLTFGIAGQTQITFKEPYNQLNAYLQTSLQNLVQATLYQRAVNIVRDAIGKEGKAIKKSTSTFDDILTAVEKQCTSAAPAKPKNGVYTKLVVKIGDTDSDVIEITAATSKPALDAINKEIANRAAEVAGKQIGGKEGDKKVASLVDNLVKKVEDVQGIWDTYPISGDLDTKMQGAVDKSFEFKTENDFKANINALDINHRRDAVNTYRLANELYKIDDNTYMIDYDNSNGIIAKSETLKKSSDLELWQILKELDADKNLEPQLTKLAYITQAHAWFAQALKLMKIAELELLLNKVTNKWHPGAETKLREADEILANAIEKIKEKFNKFDSLDANKFIDITGTIKSDYRAALNNITVENAKEFSTGAKKAFDEIKALSFEKLVEEKKTGEDNKRLLAEAKEVIDRLKSGKNTKQEGFKKGLEEIITAINEIPALTPEQAKKLAKLIAPKVEASQKTIPAGKVWGSEIPPFFAEPDWTVIKVDKDAFKAKFKGLETEKECEGFFKIFEPLKEEKPAPKSKDLFASAMKSINGGKAGGKRAGGIDTKDGAKFKTTLTAALMAVAKIDKLEKAQAEEMATALNDKIGAAQTANIYTGNIPTLAEIGTTKEVIKALFATISENDLLVHYDKFADFLENVK